jgi:transposase
VTTHAERADKIGKKLRVFFQDEGRFGRISDPRSCWAPPTVRPLVTAQHVREYLYAFAAISPHDGHMSTLIADHVNAHTMSVHLQHVANEYPDEEILMILDGASWHRAKDLRIPHNMTLKLLPPYSPELNPVEHLWDDIREKYFANQFFNSLDAVAEQLTDALREMHSDRQRVKSMSSFPWIIEEQASGNWH